MVQLATIRDLRPPIEMQRLREVGLHIGLLGDQQGRVDTVRIDLITSVHALLNLVQAQVIQRFETLEWCFSGVCLTYDEAMSAAQSWAGTGEPPVLSIIAIKIGQEAHDTMGLEPLIGYELQIKFANTSLSRDAARNLARLARHALSNKGLDRRVVFEGVGGVMLRTRWPSIDASGQPVTIFLE